MVDEHTFVPYRTLCEGILRLSGLGGRLALHGGGTPERLKPQCVGPVTPPYGLEQHQLRVHPVVKVLHVGNTSRGILC